VKIDRDHVVGALRAQRDPIEQRYGIRLVGLIGSVARGDAKPESDVDVVVDIVGTPSLFDLSRAERDLEEAIGLGMPVEIVTWEGMRPSGRAIMERDLVPLS